MSASQRVDPRLIRQMATAGDDELVQAILIIEGADDADEVGLGVRVVAEISTRAGTPPARVRYLPRASAAIIEARRSYLRVALDDPRVIVASATTIDIFPWG